MNVPGDIHEIKQLQRWIRLGLIAALVSTGILYEILTQVWFINWPKTAWVTLDTVFLAGCGLVIYLLVDKALRWDIARQAMQGENAILRETVELANQRGSVLLRISQRLAEAENESDLIGELLALTQEVTGAAGVSFVPLDERAQPLPSFSRGELPGLMSAARLEYLASPAVRQTCQRCQRSEQMVHSDCPLLANPVLDELRVYCVPLRRGGREYGILNLYLPQVISDEAALPEILRQVVEQAALALEGLRLRARELNTLRQLQATQARSDLAEQLLQPLDYLRATLEADFVVLARRVQEQRPGAQARWIQAGEIPESARPLVAGVASSVMDSGEPVSLGDVTGGAVAQSEVRAILAAPLRIFPATEGHQAGVLLAGSRWVRAFPPRQLTLLQTIANQMALVVHNNNLLAELEYKIIMEERARLAREIHDGLAQTLGFLKLKFAQMEGFFKYGEYDRLGVELPATYAALSDAYQDARQAIDGLRVLPGEAGVHTWLRQSVDEFSENSSLPVELEICTAEPDLPPEVHAQLMRIIQEALNNVRKHAQASRVWVACRVDAVDLVLEIVDDGRGFNLEDVAGPARHGLHGMRERAELVGADFQIISQPGQGATLRLRLPLQTGIQIS